MRNRRGRRAFTRREYSRRTLAVKRAQDLVLGSVLALVSIPLVLVLAAASAMILRTWPFFTQKRPGRGGREFTIVKIRTLPRHTPRYVHKFDIADDLAGLTTFLRLLRKTHLDELPQLMLVPLGRMSLVGPRPRQPDVCEPVAADVDRMRRSVRQGCTGLWQISEAAAETTAAGAPEYDVIYLAHMGMRLDLWILARTVVYMLGVARPVSAGDIPRWTLRRRREVAHPIELAAVVSAEGAATP